MASVAGARRDTDCFKCLLVAGPLRVKTWHIRALWRPLTDTWRDIMTTGLHYLDVGLVIAVFAGIFWWMYALSTKSQAQRKQERMSQRIARQPWDDDKAGGRGNR